MNLAKPHFLKGNINFATIYMQLQYFPAFQEEPRIWKKKSKKITRGTPSCFSLSASKLTPNASLNTVLQPLLLTLHINMELFPQASVPNTVSRLHLHGNQLSNSTAITFPKCWKESQVWFSVPNVPLASTWYSAGLSWSTRPMGRPRQTKRTQK